MSAPAHKQLQGNEQAAAHPVYIFRGHEATIHSLVFFRENRRLLSADEDGWVVVWSLLTKRPVAVWKAHEATVLAAEPWGRDRIITHGRDGRLRVWAFVESDEDGMSTDLPLEKVSRRRKEPWLFHSLEVSSGTFCAFASCISRDGKQRKVGDETSKPGENLKDSLYTDDYLFIAVPGSEDSNIEMYGLSSEKQLALIPAPEQSNGKTGMVMALKMLYTEKDPDESLLVIAGYESGRVYIFKENRAAAQWQSVYSSRPHDQPILSLDVAAPLEAFFTSGADAIIAKHPLAANLTSDVPLKHVQTRHAGQQGLRVRSDSRIFATAGWDARVRVYSTKTVKELAVLKWHKEGCYAVAFALVQDPQETAKDDNTGPPTDLQRSGSEISKPLAPHLSRKMAATYTHWLAAGSKDGKVSLWDIY